LQPLNLDVDRHKPMLRVAGEALRGHDTNGHSDAHSSSE
jgi:hypothetical protein